MVHRAITAYENLRASDLVAVACSLLVMIGGGTEAVAAKPPLLVSRASGQAGEKADDRSMDPAIYVRDLEASITSLATPPLIDPGFGQPAYCESPSISADGRYVAFTTRRASRPVRRCD
jgi:hypothetical protein